MQRMPRVSTYHKLFTAQDITLTLLLYTRSQFIFREDKCQTCSGQGKVRRNRKKKSRLVTCDRCRGSGKVKNKKSCTVCRGLRYTESKESTTIAIPKGGPPTGKICLTNKGHEKVCVRR